MPLTRRSILQLPLALAAADHSPWDAIVRDFVSPQSRVDYARLKRDGLPTLDRYLATVAEPWPRGLSAAERKAALINAYNALTVRWVAAAYPVESIWRTRNPFTAARHTVDSRKLSLDAIETELRALHDPRIHAALVCAARSCPPLRREAYTAAALDRQLDDNLRAWLADPALNQFDAGTRTARVSSIFDWYKEDFGPLPQFLVRYAPQAKFLRDEKARIKYMPYHWGLNDASDLGKQYGQAQFLFDRARNVF
jgi:hypothetical protein